MRKFAVLLGAVAMLSILPAAPALAQDGGATITRDGVCSGAVPDGNGGFTGIFVLGTAFSRTTKSGITTTTCHFNLTAEQSPSKTVRASNFACGTPEGITTDSRISASPGGQMVMTCRIKHASTTTLRRR